MNLVKYLLANMSSEIVTINESYTEKAVAVFGNTKPYLEELKNIGGKYNQYLKQNGSTSPGWIFPKTKLSILKALVDKINNGSIKPAVLVEKKENTVSSKAEVKTEQKPSTDSNNVVLSKDEFKYIMNTLQRLEQEVNALKKQVSPTSTYAIVKKVAKKEETPPSSESEDYNEEDYDEEEEEEEMVKKPAKKGPSFLARK